MIDFPSMIGNAFHSWPTPVSSKNWPSSCLGCVSSSASAWLRRSTTRRTCETRLCPGPWGSGWTHSSALWPGGQVEFTMSRCIGMWPGTGGAHRIDGRIGAQRFPQRPAVEGAQRRGDEGYQRGNGTHALVPGADRVEKFGELQDGGTSASACRSSAAIAGDNKPSMRCQSGRDVACDSVRRRTPSAVPRGAPAGSGSAA
jgi:hypothetical protein